MKNFTIIILFIACIKAFGQEADTVIDLMNLPPYVPPVTEQKVSHNSGWFPIPPNYFSKKVMNFSFGDNWDIARNLRSASFVPTTNGFSGIRPFDGDELERREAFTNEENDEYKSTGHFNIEYEWMFAFGNVPLFHRFGFNVTQNIGMLFTKDKSKSFLNYNNEKTPFTEGGIVTLEEWLIGLEYGWIIPIYGTIFNIDEFFLNSFYYLSVSGMIAVAVDCNGEQYMQVIDAKDQLRYSGGRDVYYMMKSRAFETIERFRAYADIALGWDFDIGPVGINVEMYYIHPLTSVLEDAWWGQIKGGIKFGFGFK